MRRIVQVVAAALAAFSSHAANALEFLPQSLGQRPIVLVTGEFLDGDTKQLNRFLEAHPSTQEVHFHSPGGLLYEGLETGRMLRSRGIATRVPRGASCVSACVWAFLGGIIRTVDREAKVGVHMATMIHNQELITSLRAELAGQSDRDLDLKLRVIMALTEKAAAKVAAEKAEYLVKMGVSLRLLAPGLDTNSWDVYFLNRYELKDFNVMNSE